MKFSKLSLIYLVAFILLFIEYQSRSGTLAYFPNTSQKEVPELIQKEEKHLQSEFQNKNLAKLIVCYMSGYYCINLAKNIKEDHQTLGIKHLFSPSGFHLSAFLLLFSPIFFFCNKKLKRPILIVICATCFFLPGLYPLKRMAFYKILSFGFERLFNYQNNFLLFLLTFSLDFIFGTYSQSPLSFIYSFLFFGVIVTHEGQSILKLSLKLFGAQVMALFFQHNCIGPLYLIFNVLLSQLFTPFFVMAIPLLLFSTMSHFCTQLLESIIAFYYKLIHFAASITHPLNILESSFLVCLFVFVCTLHFKSKRQCLKTMLVILSVMGCQSLNRDDKQHLPSFRIPNVISAEREHKRLTHYLQNNT